MLRPLVPFGCLAVTVLLAGGLGAGETRFHQYTKRFMNPKHPAKPLATGYIGGGGDEYFSGAAFLPDGTLLLAGTAYGPKCVGQA